MVALSPDPLSDDALRASEARFRTLSTSSPVGIFQADRAGNVTYVNPRILQLWEASDDAELLGRAWLTRVHPEDRQAVDDGWAAAVVDASEFVCEYRLLLPNGTIRHVRVHAAPLRDEGGLLPGTVGTAQDITEQRQAENALRTSEERNRRLVESAREGICTVDATGAITYANQRLAAMLGTTSRALVGRFLLDLVEPSAADAARARFAGRLPGDGEPHEVPFRRLDGATVWVEKSVITESGSGAMTTGATYMLTDVTARREALQRVAKSERYFRALTERSSELVTVLDARGMFRYVSPAVGELLGYTPDELLGRPGVDLVHPEDVPRVAVLLQTLSEEPGGVVATEYRIRHRDGRWRTLRTVAQNLLADPAVAGIVSNSHDVTRARATEEALRENDLRYRLLFERNPLPMYVVDLESRRFLAVNESTVAHYGFSRAAFLAMRLDDLWPPEDRVAFAAEFARPAPRSRTKACRHQRRDGTRIDVEVVADTVIFGDRPARLVMANDVTARRQAETELREAHAYLSTLVTASPLAIVTLDDRGIVQSWNPAAEQIFGWAAAEVVGRENPTILPGDRAQYEQILEQERHAGRGRSNVEKRLVRKDGSIVDAAVSSALLRGPDGAVVGAMGLIADVSARKKAEAALDDARRQTDLLVTSAGEGICALDASGRITFVNPAAARLFGATAEDLIGQEAHARIRHAGADGADGRWEDSPICASIDEGAVHRVDTAVFRREDGTLFPVEYVSTPLRERGQIVGAVVAFQDITHRKQLEEQFRQSQKMEAIGRLAGGVAHDFNNLLTVITSYAMMLLTELPAEDPLRPDLLEIQAAAERAAVLTRQLLAFSRRQVLDPRVIDLHQTIAGITRMLPRLIGEDIELSITARDGPAYVLADAGQVEQVIMNLVVNARDAMPTGGRLSIESGVAVLTTEDVQRHPYVVPGEYVRVEVADTGCGMDPETQSRIFDPFFTTKEAGKGTGLGLATVYGIVKQSGGYVWVNSAPGQGSTFQIHLPCVADEPQRDDRDAAPAAISTAQASATVLLAEDEDSLRAIMHRILRKCGYSVLCARSGAEALAMAERHDGPIDLLVTDVVMPYMSGQELAEQLLQRLGDVPVLFMSGYSMDAVTNHGVLRPGAHLLKKPFTPADLTLAASELLRAHGRAPVALP